MAAFVNARGWRVDISDSVYILDKQELLYVFEKSFSMNMTWSITYYDPCDMYVWPCFTIYK